jgi:2'-5' RNA ligase
MAEIIRSFLAVEIPDSNKERIQEFLNPLKVSSKAFIKWVNKENYHITLKFLAELNTDHLSPIRNELEGQLSSIPAFNLQSNRLGVFPNTRNPRIFWLGFEHRINLDRIFNRVENCLVNLGYEKDHLPLFPHLTLGRTKREVCPGQIAEFTQKYLNLKANFIINFQVSHVGFIHSELTRNGPIYSRLFQISLAQ